jgi:flagellar assembly protein FliH
MREKMVPRAGYVKPSEEELDQIQRWRYPDVEDERKKANPTPTNVLGMAPGKWRRPEPEQEEEEPQPPTAEEIEEIRRAAYEDGFAEGNQAGQVQGREEGLKQGFEEGHAQGVEQGRQEGLAQGQAIIDEKAMALEALLRQLHAPLENVDREVERSLVNLTAQLAEEVIRTELSTNPDVILQVLHEAIGVLPLNTGAITLDLHPDDLVLVQQQYDADMLQERGWRLRAEPALSRGDISIASERSYVDVSMKQRVRDLLERFLHQSVERVSEPQEQATESEHQAEADAVEATGEETESQPAADAGSQPEASTPDADSTEENEK